MLRYLRLQPNTTGEREHAQRQQEHCPSLGQPWDFATRHAQTSFSRSRTHSVTHRHLRVLTAAVAWAMRSWQSTWRTLVGTMSYRGGIGRGSYASLICRRRWPEHKTSIEPGGFVRMHLDQLGMHVASGRHARFQGGETSSGRCGYDGREGLSSGTAAAGLPRKR